METILMLNSYTDETKVLWSSGSEKTPLFDGKEVLYGFYVARDDSEKVFIFEDLQGYEFSIDQKACDFVLNFVDKNLPPAFWRSRFIA